MWCFEFCHLQFAASARARARVKISSCEIRDGFFEFCQQNYCGKKNYTF